MTNYKFIKDNDENESSNNKSNTSMPAQNRKRHKPVRGIPRTGV